VDDLDAAFRQTQRREGLWHDLVEALGAL